MFLFYFLSKVAALATDILTSYAVLSYDLVLLDHIAKIARTNYHHCSYTQILATGYKGVYVGVSHLLPPIMFTLVSSVLCPRSSLSPFFGTPFYYGFRGSYIS